MHVLRSASLENDKVCFQWGSGSPIQGLQLELDTSPSCLYGWLIAPISVSRNETYCVTGSVKLLVYEASSADMKKLYFTIDLVVGERLKYSCPNLDDFNKTDRLINWTKVRDQTLCTEGGVMLQKLSRVTEHLVEDELN